MIRTRVGYAGGTSLDPTYHDLGDHTEALAVDFDPTQISYRELLELFWSSHSPTRRPWSRQYATILFAGSDEQAKTAQQSRDEVAAELDEPITTELRSGARFYPAEDYHQKYYLRGTPTLMQELAIYRDDDPGLRDSTAAARLNGWLGKHATADAIAAELEHLDLSAAGRGEVMDLARG